MGSKKILEDIIMSPTHRVCGVNYIMIEDKSASIMCKKGGIYNDADDDGVGNTRKKIKST